MCKNGKNISYQPKSAVIVQPVVFNPWARTLKNADQSYQMLYVIFHYTATHQLCAMEIMKNKIIIIHFNTVALCGHSVKSFLHLTGMNNRPMLCPLSMASVYILSLFISCHLYVYNFANDSRLDYYWYMLNIPKT